MTTPRTPRWITVPLFLMASALSGEEPAATTQPAEEPSAKTTTEVFQLKRAAAESVCQTLREVFPAPPSGPASHYKITIVPETHSLLVTCSPEVIEDVRRLIASLDLETPVARRMTRIALQHVSAKQARDLLPWLLPDAIRAGGPCYRCSTGTSGPMIVYDENSNALIVSATDDEFTAVRGAVDLIDRPRRDADRPDAPTRASIVTFRVQGPADKLAELSIDELLPHASDIVTLRTALAKLGQTAPVIRTEQWIWLENREPNSVSIGVKTPVMLDAPPATAPADDDEGTPSIAYRTQGADGTIQGSWLDAAADLAYVNLKLKLTMQEDVSAASDDDTMPSSDRSLLQSYMGPLMVGRPTLLLSLDTDAQGGAVAHVTRFALEPLPTSEAPTKS